MNDPFNQLHEITDTSIELLNGADFAPEFLFEKGKEVIRSS